MKALIFTLFIVLVSTTTGWAQFPDTLQQKEIGNPDEIAFDTIGGRDTLGLRILTSDSTLIVEAEDTTKGNFIRRFFEEDYPSPRKAALLSLVIPGAGQAYNKRYWKMPIVYGAIGGLAYAIEYNGSRYKRLRTAYELALQEKPHEFTGTPIDNRTSLRNLRDQFDKNTQLSWIGLVAVQVLGAVDAFVDGHLLNFDISDDLSLGVKPEAQFLTFSQQAVPGVGICLVIK